MHRALITLFTVAFLASPASAKMRKAEPAPAAPFSWTGFYLGIHGGMITDGGSDIVYTVAGNYEPAGRVRPVGWDDPIYGIHGGYLHQFPGGVVVGAEAAVSFGGSGVLRENLPPVGNDYRTTTEGGPLYMGTGRIGYAWDRFMLYAKGGYAWQEVDFDAAFFNKDGPMGSNGTQVKISNSFQMHGFVYGAGAEVMIVPNMTLGIEWMRVDLGESDVVTLKTTNSGILTEKLKMSHGFDAAMGRLNFKF